MFDFAPITAPALITAALAGLVTYFCLHLARPWLRAVSGQPGIRYGGSLLIAVTAVLSIPALRDSPRLLMSFTVAAVVVLLAGAADEHLNLSPARQLLWQALAATAAVFGGWTISFISQTTGAGVIVFNPLLGGALAIIWLLLLMNAVNWLDGVDGLAGSVVGLAFLTLAAVSLLPSVQDSRTFTLALVGAAAVGGFLVWNWPPARLYLGASGSWWLGLYIGMVAIQGGGKIVTTLLVLALPVADALAVFLWRLRAGQAPWQGDTTHHLHHRLRQLGISHQTITLFAAVLTALLAAAALTLQTQQKILALVAAISLIIVAGFILAIKNSPNQPRQKKAASLAILAVFVILASLIFVSRRPCRNFNEAAVAIGPARWAVAVADTAAEHNHGLMECPHLPEAHGMYFVFQQPSTQPFWMKNMLIPLDIVWISEDRIIGLERSVPIAGDESSPPRYFAPQPYTAVLEIPAGEADQHSLAIGQEVALIAF